MANMMAQGMSAQNARCARREEYGAVGRSDAVHPQHLAAISRRPQEMGVNVV